METKDLLGLALVLVAIPACVAVACFLPRFRDGLFFLMIFACVVIYKVDVNFFSHFWYRGITRGFEFSLVDVLAIAVLISSFVFPRSVEHHRYWPASLGLMIFFFLFCLGDVALSEPKIYGLFELSQMLRGIIVFLAAAYFVRSERELSILVVALCSAVCFEAIIAVKQRMLEGVYRVPATLDDPNSFSMYLCLVSPVFIAAAASTLPRYVQRFALLSVAAATLSIVFTISRAGIPIFALVMIGTAAWCVSWRLTPQKVVGAALVLLLVGGLIYKSWHLLEARYSSDTLATEYLDENAYESRGYFLRLAKIIVQDRFFGVGLNNWSYWVSKKYGAQLGTPYEDYDDLTYVPNKEILPSFNYAAPAHNLAALTIGELGVPGLMIFTLLWLRWFQLGTPFLFKRSDRATHILGIGIFFGVCGIFLQSITEWVYHQPHIYFTFYALIGVLASLGHMARKKKAPSSSAVPRVKSQAIHYEHVGASAQL